MISTLKIFTKTNVEGHLKYEPYKVTNSSNTINIDKERLRIPEDTILMSNLVPLEMKYFPEKTVDYLNSVSYSDSFIKILSNKLKDYKAENRKEYKTTHEQAENNKIPHYNILIILERIFKQGTPFFYDKDRTMTLLNFFWDGTYVVNITSSSNKDFRTYEVYVNLEIDLRAPDKISPEELKKASCKSQKEKIKRIWSSIRNIEYTPPIGNTVELPSAPAMYTNNVSVGGELI